MNKDRGTLVKKISIQDRFDCQVFVEDFRTLGFRLDNLVRSNVILFNKKCKIFIFLAFSGYRVCYLLSFGFLWQTKRHKVSESRSDEKYFI